MKKLWILMIAVMVSLTSCGKSEADTIAKHISKIQEENGIPVRLNKVEKSDLSSWKDYSGVLEGKEQIVIYGMLGDKLTDIHVKIGDRVEKDQILAEYSNENPQAKNRQAQIAVETLEKTYNRMLTIYQSGGISQQQLDEVSAQYDVAKENLKASGKLLAIKSPIDGVITDKFVDVGQIIDSHTPLLKVASTNKLVAQIFVDESQINSIKTGAVAQITWDGESKNEFKGKVDKVSLSAIPERRGFQAEISIEDPKKILKPGMFVTVNLEIARLNNAVHINRNVMREEGGKIFVFTVENDKATKKEIIIGRSLGFEVEVLSGLSGGEELVIEGQNMVSDNSKVKIVN